MAGYVNLMGFVILITVLLGAVVFTLALWTSFAIFQLRT
jgi:hypothetical protein